MLRVIQRACHIVIDHTIDEDSCFQREAFYTGRERKRQRADILGFRRPGSFLNAAVTRISDGSV